MRGSRTRTRRASWGGVLAVVALLALTAPAGADPEASQPVADGLISKNGTTYIGNDVYNGGAGQAHTRSVARGATGLFYLQLQNDGTQSELAGLTGCPGNANFKVQYFGVLPGMPPFDLTSQVVAGNRAALGAGQTATFLVKVKVKPAAPAGSSFSCKVRATYGSGGATTDNVKFTVTRA